MNYLLLLSNVIKTNTTCPLSGGGYSCMCDGGAIYCPRYVSNIAHAKLNAIFLLVDLVEESILIHIIFFYR